ncbi:nuclear transport factor 2 family protein [Pendulispora albinea]|uniref:Nuclear transport factor 2 family protein n=1 Tax=Pendulispora albinea TaxID=2741071 RepID=A0ABZ2LZG5_9BACT
MAHPLEASQTGQLGETGKTGETEQLLSAWRSWLDAWNRHDLEGILAHYAEDVVFTSNAVKALGFDPSGSVKGIALLRQLFEAGLRAYPDLHFTPIQAFGGVRSHALHYIGIEKRLVVEVHEVDARGRIVIASAYHGPRSA